MKRRQASLRLLLSAAAGVSFFLLPLPSGGRFTVAFDLAVRAVVDRFPAAVSLYLLLIISAGAGGSLAASLRGKNRDGFLSSFPSERVWQVIRVLGLFLALVYFFRIGPDQLTGAPVRGLMWETLAGSVGVIIPIGAAFLVLFVRYGFLEFVGTLMRPVMRPLFRLPGRAALDSMTSWVGSYSVGLYLTRELMQEGYYNRREAYAIATCFSTVSIGFVAVVAKTLDLLPLFPVIFLCYFFSVYLAAALLARTWPIARVPATYLSTPRPEVPERSEGESLLREAWKRGLRQAAGAPPVPASLRDGLIDGLTLVSTILGSILVVGTAALLLARETPLFRYLGRPFQPALQLLGIPDAATVAPATVAGITEMYIPALLVTHTSAPARFFVAVLSVSQLIFFSSVGPMILDMFRQVPVRAYELAALFFMRTALLIPVVAGMTALVRALGLLG